MKDFCEFMNEIFKSQNVDGPYITLLFYNNCAVEFQCKNNEDGDFSVYFSFQPKKEINKAYLKAVNDNVKNIFVTRICKTIRR